VTTSQQDNAARLRHDAAVTRAIAFFEAISPADVERIDTIYAPDAWFKDPFNEVQGVSAIQRVFAHMFVALEQPRFIVRETVSDGTQAFLVWDFEFAFRRGAPRGVQRIRGCSQLRFDEQGRIDYHRDFWDAAEELYEKLPVLGALMRWLRRKAGG
jgi:ketosteroid isomerase-like protein